MLPSATFTTSASQLKISELIPRGPLHRCLRFAPDSLPIGMARLATGLPATALAGLDFHQLDPTKRFHLLIFRILPFQALLGAKTNMFKAFPDQNSR